MSITLSFIQELIKLHNPVKARHKHDLLLAVFTRATIATSIIIPHQKLLQSDWSFTHQHFRCLVLSPFESCRMVDIMLPRKPNICHMIL